MMKICHHFDEQLFDKWKKFHFYIQHQSLEFIRSVCILAVAYHSKNMGTFSKIWHHVISPHGSFLQF